MTRRQALILAIYALTFLGLGALFWDGIQSMAFWTFLGHLAIADLIIAGMVAVTYIVYTEYWR